MRHHPVTPMEDAHLGRLIERQGRGKAALIARRLSPGRRRAGGSQRSGGALCGARRPQRTGSAHPGVALREMKLVSGGSGLAIGLARDWAQRHGAGESAQAGMPLAGPAVVLSAPAR